MKRKCQYCYKWYEDDKPHECPEKLVAQRKHKNAYQKQYAKNETAAQKILHTKSWKQLRKNVMQADNGMCQRCLIKDGKITMTDLQVHHIVPRIVNPELGYNMDNLITLCKKCNTELALNDLDFDWTPEKRKNGNISQITI